MADIIEKIEALPDGEAEVITGDAPIRYADISGDDLKALTSELREARKVIEHYADENIWSDPHPDCHIGEGVLYDFDDEVLGVIPGYHVAQEHLNKYGKD